MRRYPAPKARPFPAIRRAAYVQFYNEVGVAIVTGKVFKRVFSYRY